MGPSFADAPFTIPTPRRQPPSSYQLPPHCYEGQNEGQTDGFEGYLPHTSRRHRAPTRRTIAGKTCELAGNVTRLPHHQDAARHGWRSALPSLKLSWFLRPATTTTSHIYIY